MLLSLHALLRPQLTLADWHLPGNLSHLALHVLSVHTDFCPRQMELHTRDLGLCRANLLVLVPEKGNN